MFTLGVEQKSYPPIQDADKLRVWTHECALVLEKEFPLFSWLTPSLPRIFLESFTHWQEPISLLLS